MVLTRVIDSVQSSTQYLLWAGVDSRPGLGYCVIAREVIPAGSFVFEYAGQYLTVSLPRIDAAVLNSTALAANARWVESLHSTRLASGCLWSAPVPE